MQNCIYHTRNQVRADVFFHSESFCNHRLRHAALDYRSPEAYERLTCQLNSMASSGHWSTQAPQAMHFSGSWKTTTRSP
jgi:hypothetical protein